MRRQRWMAIGFAILTFVTVVLAVEVSRLRQDERRLRCQRDAAIALSFAASAGRHVTARDVDRISTASCSGKHDIFDL